MRTSLRAALVLLASCGGGPDPDAGGDTDGGTDAGPVLDCTGLDDGTMCGAGRICVDGTCDPTRCGDGVTDPATEQCDDGNTVAFDGCNPDCRRTCIEDAECEDANPCNGDNTCDIGTSVCERGEPLAPGSPCSTAAVAVGVCDGAADSECVAPGCGNGVVDGAEQCDDAMNGDDEDGCTDACEFSCELDEECSDASVCTGIERCDVETHACVTEGDLTCTPSDACHIATCDAMLGCVDALIDADGDGHSPTSAGPCGDDCEDGNPTVYSGAEEICDGLDNNCVGGIDEAAPTWYVDCDGDEFAANSDASRVGCTEPPGSATGCPGASAGWTNTRPTGPMTTDCDDAAAMVFPGADEIVGNEVDESCDGTEVCFLDGDDDSFRRPDGAPIASSDLDCDDAREAAGSVPATDCNDSSSTTNPGATETPGDNVDRNCDMRESCYRDMDDDGYRTTSTFTGSDADCSDAGEALATDPSGDCCDTDARVRPGTTSYYGTSTNCASGDFDFNCDGSETQRYSSGTCGSGVSCSTGFRAGYSGGVPGCGASGLYISSSADCMYDFEFRVCFLDGGASRQQLCR